MAQPPQAPPHPPLTGVPLILATISLSLATFMNVLDTTIANVALTPIAGDLGVSPSQGTWIITSFAVSSAISVPLTGWLTQRLGALRLFLMSTFLFTAASVLCGLSQSLNMLVAARVLQGMVSGPMIPLCQALLLQSYPKEKAGLALAFWGMTATIAPVMGPILGGWLTDNWSWPWIFFINIPVGLLSIWVTAVVLRGRESPTRHVSVDYIGLILLVVWVGATQIMLDRGKELDWFNTTEIVVLAVVAVVGFTLFLIWELTEEHPIVDLSLFAQRNFAAGCLALTLGYSTFFGTLVLIPMWLQRTMGYTATWAGLVTAPIGILALIISPVIGRTMGTVDPRWFATLSFIVMALCNFWRATFSPDVDAWTIANTHLWQGIAMATFFIPLTAIILSGLEPHRIPSASGLFNFLRLMAAAFAASLWTTGWENNAARHHAYLTEHVTAASTATTQALENAQALGLTHHQALALVNERIVTPHAQLLSILDMFWLAGGLFLILIAAIWLSRPASPPRH
ncbi:DHA2 family efflux MFS transporter permease subunit [Rhodospira trueperi]|uniref:MFS transporter, DHA2 family, multidrug resistance protein n=1 Tax=Rhodospira trueperi TaxID=69960 RepID=A0A1G7EMJ7_9PROT|nr:DHA2 family efflux MFS transporter permease subunit [Rhodospira trueperi]SDE64930.1 MFS transporter, DHA2 family, multidrug resistance protein [Rhodospira trueperi]